MKDRNFLTAGITKVFLDTDENLNRNYNFNTESSGSTCIIIMIIDKIIISANLGDSGAAMSKSDTGNAWTCH